MEQTQAEFQVVGKMVSNPRFDVAIFQPCDTEHRPATYNEVVFVEGEYYRMTANHQGGFTLHFCTPEVQAYYSGFVCDVRIGLEEIRASLANQNAIAQFLAPLNKFSGLHLPVEETISNA